jgi:hypothetical protein
MAMPFSSTAAARPWRSRSPQRAPISTVTNSLTSPEQPGVSVDVGGTLRRYGFTSGSDGLEA